MIVFYIIAALLGDVVVAQQPSVSCRYVLYDYYGCDITINNPNGFNNFTEIGGIHLEGHTDADVTNVFLIDGVSTNIPSIICDTFPNLNSIGIYYAGLTAVGDSDLSGCSQLTQIGLSVNRIASISPNAFANIPNLRGLNLDSNLLTTLPENLFSNQENLEHLELSYNLFDDIPPGLFRPLVNLQYLSLSHANLTAINNQWFTTLERLGYLSFWGNSITLSADNFVGLGALIGLDLGFNAISEIPSGTFTPLQNLQDLFLYANSLTELLPDTFADLGRLRSLDVSENPIQTIEDGAFRGLENLVDLYMAVCRLRLLQPSNFEDLTNLNSLNLNFNQIEDLPPGIFAPLSNLTYIGLWRNRLKTVRRNAFGTLGSLRALDLDENIVNALDRTIFDDAIALDSLSFTSNLCADSYFFNIQLSRDRFLEALETCFNNMRYIVDTVTEGDEAYTFFDGRDPGIVLRINTDNEVQIALTPFNFEWRPIVEIFIGASNNTRSIIRINQETDVVTVPTPNVITPGQWNDFRITWLNQIVLVYAGNEPFPFMGYTMQDFFPVSFYGLRAVETRATWSVQPLE